MRIGPAGVPRRSGGGAAVRDWLEERHEGAAAMGVYTERVLPRLVDAACGTRQAAVLRRRVCAQLTGSVVEIGFGSGRNVPYYPPALTRVDAVEPSDTGWRLAGGRVRASSVPVLRSGQDGHALPYADATFDAAVSTWTLCTIPDPATALREVRRVLRPGGTLRFVEHGLAPDEDVRRWQRRLEPFQRRLAGGCRLTRPIPELLTGAGFTLTELDVFYEEGVPRFVGAMSLGSAVREPGAGPGPGPESSRQGSGAARQGSEPEPAAGPAAEPGPEPASGLKSASVRQDSDTAPEEPAG